MREGSEMGSMILAADYSYGAVHLVGFALVLAVAAVLAFVAASIKRKRARAETRWATIRSSAERSIFMRKIVAERFK